MYKPEQSKRKRLFHHLLWLAVAVTPALIAMRGIFSRSSIFYIRDLANYFYPNYLWIRHTFFAGHLPLWNPDAGAGYADVADPSFQLFFLPTLFVRFLLPEALGFNFMVAFPFVAAVVGTYLFFKRHTGMVAAALGAIIFSVSGPLLSSSNSINPSTTASMLPWLLWAADRLFERQSVGRFSLLAALFALAFFAGQPDMLAWEALLVTLYTGFVISQAEDKRRVAIRRMLTVIGSGMVGLFLSAIQFLPLLDVMRRSHRGSGTMADGWSIHPFGTLQFFLPTLFSSPLDPTAHLHPWMFQLNGGREPYLYSIYLGVVALLLGLFGVVAGTNRRWKNFWMISFVCTFILAIGYYTPIYKVLHDSIPLLGFFRYPAKLTILMAFSLAALAATAFHALPTIAERIEKKRTLYLPIAVAAVLVIISAIISILVLWFPNQAGSLLSVLAEKLSLDNSTIALSDMVAELKQSAPRLFGLALCTAGVLWVGMSNRKEARLARQVLFAAVVFDLLMANASLNPTVELSKVTEPQWVAATRAHSQDRIYTDDQSGISLSPQIQDFTFYVPPDMSLSQADVSYHSIVPYNAIRFGLRDALIVDVTKLRPQEYTQMVKLFKTKDAESRTRFLLRNGVRYFLQPEPPACEAIVVQQVPTLGSDRFALYEAKDTVPRISIVEQAEVEPEISTQFEKIFTPEFDPTKTVLLKNLPPEASGKPGQAASPSATIIKELPTEVDVQASTSTEGGYLLLRDMYDPNWQVEVDGESAPLLRANGIHRAVRLTQGEHLVRFVYKPRFLFWGAGISGITALLLIGLSWRRKKVVLQVEDAEEVVPELQVCES
jgi:hypothetical protein